MLDVSFKKLAGEYSDDSSIIDSLWLELNQQYSGRSRHYHNLTHIQNLIMELEKVKSEIKDWNTILFSVFYHDVIYNARKKDNEAKSAVLATKRMSEIQVPPAQIALCKEQILSTKNHNISVNSDTNYLTDADLSILGKDWDTYREYFQNVRKEYAIYPDFLYKPGRKKALKHFLKMDHIFKTEHFSTLYEVQAIENIRKEIDLL